MNSNELLSTSFAKDFNKNYGVITYSGTLAIEAALISLNLKKHSKVLVLSEVCYSIINTILKLEFIPVIVIPKNSLYLVDEDLDRVLTKHNIDCILLVHQYGIINKIDKKIYKEKGIKIIEDVAQTWNVNNSNYTIGEHSDIVVTSFGKTKPLSYGIGGGLFFNKKSMSNIFDYYDNCSREKESILLSYTYPLCENIKYNELKKQADKIIKEQRNNAKKYFEILKNQTLIKYIEYNIEHVWHRFPIWLDDSNLYNKIVDELKKTNLEYQLLHEINLIDLKRNKNCIKYDNQKQKKYIILLRTRNIDINNQIEILKKITNIV